MAVFGQLFGLGYDRVGELLHYVGVQTARQAVPNFHLASGELPFRASWLTSLIITGAVVGAPIALLVRRLKHVSALKNAELVSLNYKNDELRNQVGMVAEYFSVSDKLAVELQDMVSFALTLIDQLSNDLEAAQQFQLICERKYETLQEQFHNEKELYENTCELLAEQLKYQEGKYAKLEDMLAQKEEELVQQRHLHEVLEDKLTIERKDHADKYSELTDRYETLKENHKVLSSTHEQLVETNQNLQVKSREVTADFHKMTQDRDYWKNTYEGFKSKFDEILNNNVDMLRKQMKLMRGKSLKYRAMVDENKLDQKNLERKIYQLEEKCYEMKKTEEKMYRQLKLHESDDKPWTDEMSQLKRQVKELKKKIEKSNAKFSAMKKNMKEKMTKNVKELEPDLNEEKPGNIQILEVAEAVASNKVDVPTDTQPAVDVPLTHNTKPVNQNGQLAVATLSKLNATASCFVPAKNKVLSPAPRNSVFLCKPGVTVVVQRPVSEGPFPYGDLENQQIMVPLPHPLYRPLPHGGHVNGHELELNRWNGHHPHHHTGHRTAGRYQGRN